MKRLVKAESEQELQDSVDKELHDYIENPN